MTKVFNKLVRDKIPEIIKANGDLPTTRVLDDSEYESMLNAKLLEEVKEYLADNNPEELADILEVVRAIGQVKHLSLDDIIKMMEEKKAKRGGFTEKIFLIETN